MSPKKNHPKKTFIAVICILATITQLAVMVWNSELRYSLPTAVPANYKSVDTCSMIDFAGTVKGEQ